MISSEEEERQASHFPQGSPSFGERQLMARAKMRAVEVFPVPRVPQNRYAWAILPDATWFFRVDVICSWPTTSKKRAGLYLRYKAS